MKVCPAFALGLPFPWEPRALFFSTEAVGLQADPIMFTKNKGFASCSGLDTLAGKRYTDTKNGRLCPLMLLSTQTEALGSLYGEPETIRMLAKAGFDAFDLSLFSMFSDPNYPMNRPDFRDFASQLKDVAKDCGIVCNQAHAPFASSVGDPERDRAIFQSIVQAMEGAAIVGAKIIVVHPMHHLSYRTHATQLMEMNLDFYRRLIPYCEKFGIQVACENMWQYNEEGKRIIDSVCSRPEEFCRYLDELDSPWIVGCLDVGHTALTDEDLGCYIRQMGRKRLRALHVHDNDLRDDDHTLPFTGKIDFAALTSALAEIGYEGDFTLEADAFLLRFPKELVPEALGLMGKTGRYLAEQVERAKPVEE